MTNQALYQIEVIDPTNEAKLTVTRKPSKKKETLIAISEIKEGDIRCIIEGDFNKGMDLLKAVGRGILPAQEKWQSQNN